MAHETPTADKFSGPDFFTQPEPDHEGYEERRLAAALAKRLYQEALDAGTATDEELEGYRNLHQFMNAEAERFGVQEGILVPPPEVSEEP